MRPLRVLSALFASASAVAALVLQDRASRAEGRAEDAEDGRHKAELELERANEDLWNASILAEDTEDRFTRALDAARATADACYEIGWRAIVDRDNWRRSRGRMAAWAESLSESLYSADARIEAAIADAAQARAAYQSAVEREGARERGHKMQVAGLERALDDERRCRLTNEEEMQRADATIGELRAKVAELDAKLIAAVEYGAEATVDLDTLRTEWATPLGMRWVLVAIEPAATATDATWCTRCNSEFYAVHSPECPHYSVPIEPAVAVAPVACTWCGSAVQDDWRGRGYYCPLVPGSDTLLPLCRADAIPEEPSYVAIRARHAAREQAKATAPAVVEQSFSEHLAAASAEVATWPEWKRNAGLAALAPMADADDEAAVDALMARHGATLETRPIVAPATPTQDQLDDAAVTALLSRGRRRGRT